MSYCHSPPTSCCRCKCRCCRRSGAPHIWAPAMQGLTSVVTPRLPCHWLPLGTIGRVAVTVGQEEQSLFELDLKGTAAGAAAVTAPTCR